MSRDVTTSFGCDYILQQVAAGQIASAGMVAVSYVQRISEKVTGGSLEESKEALAIAETATLFCTVGVHPTRCKVGFTLDVFGDPEKHLQDLLTLTKEGKEKGKVVAIGECGLDYDKLHFCPSDIQKNLGAPFGDYYSVGLPCFHFADGGLAFSLTILKYRYFENQFEYAYTTKLPMFLHMRAAAQDFCDILQRNEDRFVAGVAHSFTGCAEDSDKLLSFSNVFVGEISSP
ncbi:hypothetical protein CQW23_13973 [Capsicum baccatum]|uniref:Uncharacterized protein n=1 Tax=Capsicum baccatum TaxID=33114 RepID=A0A2G2WHU5_CAPBA|nr:hypothetical protein CQW23_13973 [Capsicum baccatum]